MSPITIEWKNVRIYVSISCLFISDFVHFLWFLASDNNSEKRYAFYDEMARCHPRSLAPLRLPLAFASGKSFYRCALVVSLKIIIIFLGPKYYELVSSYIKKMLRKCVPPLFLILRVCYNDQNKVSLFLAFKSIVLITISIFRLLSWKIWCYRIPKAWKKIIAFPVVSFFSFFFTQNLKIFCFRRRGRTSDDSAMDLLLSCSALRLLGSNGQSVDVR